MSGKMQDQFEEWAHKKELSIPVNRAIAYNQHTQLAWEAWQASRSVGVSIPPVEYFGDSWSGGWAIERQNVVDALEQQGFLVEENK